MQSNNLYLFLRSALQISLRANKQCLVFNRSILHPQAAEFVWSYALFVGDVSTW